VVYCGHGLGGMPAVLAAQADMCYDRRCPGGLMQVLPHLDSSHKS